MSNFVLESLNSSVSMGVAGNLYSTAIPALDVSAVAVLYVDVDDMKSVFQYQTDSADFTNSDATDIKYFVDMASWPTLNPANAMLNVGGLSTGAIALTDSCGNSLASNKLMIAHDFARYLALKLFGTHFGVALFNNETQMLQNLRSICDDSASGHTWYDVVSKLTAVSKTGTHAGIAGSSGSKYMTNATTSTDNLCRVLFTQMIGTNPERFAGVSASDQAQPIPFQVNDSIRFKLTIGAAEGQEELTDVAPIGDRTYEIRLVLKASADVINTAVDANEE